MSNRFTIENSVKGKKWMALGYALNAIIFTPCMGMCIISYLQEAPDLMWLAYGAIGCIPGTLCFYWGKAVQWYYN